MQAEAQASGQTDGGRPTSVPKLGARGARWGQDASFYQRRPGLLRAGFLKCGNRRKNRR